jgi:hypothetical protein
MESTKTTVTVEVEAEQLYESKETELATSSTEQVAKLEGSRTPMASFEDWLDENEMTEGVNFKEDGSLFVIVYDEQVVNAKGDPKNVRNRWVQARNVAYSRAVLNAKAQIADAVSAEVTSARSARVLDIGGDTLPPVLTGPAKQLSIMDKALTLAGKELDHQIQKFEPEWDGTGKSEAERQKRLVQYRETYKESLGAVSRLFTTGALPIFTAEGRDEDGNYVVGVGMVWSTKTQFIAEAIFDSALALPKDDPEPSIRDQLKLALNNNPDFLAVSSGVRLWTNENGEQTIIAIVGLDRTKSKQRNRRESGLRGRSMIAQFVAEQVEAKDQAETEMVTDQLVDGSSETFDAGEFNSAIAARSKTIRLSGVSRAFRWTGKHPASKAKMLVDVWAWTPSARQQAATLARISDRAEKSMRQKGAQPAIPTNTETAKSKPVAVPATAASRGATTKKSKW